MAKIIYMAFGVMVLILIIAFGNSPSPEQLREKAKQEITIISAELKQIPVSKFQENLNRYRRLAELDPRNKLYDTKIKYYETRIAEAEKPLSIVSPPLSGTNLTAESFIKTAIYFEINTDDYDKYREMFINASIALIQAEYCSIADFAPPYSEGGNYGPGWIKSTEPLIGSKAYYKYCKKPHLDYRFYLDVKTGEVFKFRNGKKSFLANVKIT